MQLLRPTRDSRLTNLQKNEPDKSAIFEFFNSKIK